MQKITQCGERANIKDILWNAFMVKDCTQWQAGMPLCETKRIEIPQSIITWKEAVTLYNKYSKKYSKTERVSKAVRMCVSTFRYATLLNAPPR